MCGPAAAAAVPYIVAAVGAATSVYSVVQADRQAKAQNKAAQEQLDLEAERAEREAMDRQNNLQAQSLQEASKFQQQREQLALEARQEFASQKTASAESGLAGVQSVRSFVAASIAQDQARSDLELSEEFTTFGVNQQARGISRSEQDRKENALLNAQSNMRRRAGAGDFIGAGISGAASGYSSGSGFVSNNPKLFS